MQERTRLQRRQSGTNPVSIFAGPSGSSGEARNLEQLSDVMQVAGVSPAAIHDFSRISIRAPDSSTRQNEPLLESETTEGDTEGVQRSPDDGQGQSSVTIMRQSMDAGAPPPLADAGPSAGVSAPPENTSSPTPVASPPTPAAPGMPAAQRTADLPPESPYNNIAPGLLAKLRHSYLTHTAQNKNLDNAFWGGEPANFEDALNRFGTADIATLSHVYQRASAAGGVWDYIESIQNVWTGTSRGFMFNCTSTSGMRSFLNQSDVFCRDSMIGESMHDGNCWREIISGSPGLHVCLGQETGIHIDMHQTVLGKGPGINLLGPLAPVVGEDVFPTLCIYDPLAVLDHWSDLHNENGQTIFQRVDSKKGEIHSLRDQVRQMPNNPENSQRTATLEADLDTAERLRISILPRFRELAARGLQGETDAQANASLMADLELIETILESVRRRLNPAPSGETGDFEPLPVPAGPGSAYA